MPNLPLFQTRTTPCFAFGAESVKVISFVVMSTLPPKEIGRRLIELRKALSREVGRDLSQRDLASRLNVSQTVIQKAEQGKGSITSLVRLLLFYQQYHFNMNWVLAPDNSQLPMRTHEIDEKLEKIHNLKLIIQDMGL